MEQVIKKKKKKWIIFIIIPIIILIVAFLVYCFLTKIFIFQEKVRTNDTGFTYAMEELVINLKDDNRYLKTEIALGYGVKKDEDLIKQKETQLLDNIISILRSKSREDIMPVENTEGLKNEIKSRLNQQFEEKVITDIYITEFLIQ